MYKKVVSAYALNHPKTHLNCFSELLPLISDLVVCLSRKLNQFQKQSKNQNGQKIRCKTFATNRLIKRAFFIFSIKIKSLKFGNEVVEKRRKTSKITILSFLKAITLCVKKLSVVANVEEFPLLCPYD